MAPKAATLYAPTIRYTCHNNKISIENREVLFEFPRSSMKKAAEKFLRKMQPSKSLQNQDITVNKKLEDIEKFIETIHKGSHTDKNFNLTDSPTDTHDTSELAKSNVISLEQFREISSYLPFKTFSKRATLVYSSFEHGFSLQTLYRKSRAWSVTNGVFDDQTPSLLLVSDSNGHVFGATLSSLPRLLGKCFVGNGESMVFTLEPNVNVYPWSGRNDLFLNCEKDSMSIGGSHSECGPGMGSAIWIDSDLSRGRSRKCQTYNSSSFTLEEDFEICGIELWTFSI